MASRGVKRASEERISDEEGRTPTRKRNRTVGNNAHDGETMVETPTKPRRGRPPGSGKKQQKLAKETAAAGTKSLPLSNSKPSTRLTEETERFWQFGATSHSESSANSEESGENGTQEAATPAKRKPGKRKKKSPTPPTNLPPHEQFFWQNRPGKVKTSNNTLSSLSLLSHEQYHNQISAYQDPHSSSYQHLHSLHRRAFPQWRFELSQSFNICLYGYGSKRDLVTDFAHYLYRHSNEPPKILMVNGYTPSLTLRSILTNLAPLVYDCSAASLPKLPTQPRDLLSAILTHLSSRPPNKSSRLFIFINSLDAAPLRRGNTPNLLAQLAAHPDICMLATCDTPNFPLLWDVPTQERYNFLFHDATTFISYASVEAPSAEIPDVVDMVNVLLGRSGRTIKGKEGVGYVLRSLPENARNLYRILISEILAGLDSGLDGGAGGGRDGNDEDDGEDDYDGSGRGAAVDGIAYKTLYQKTVEEFVCSSEMGFRQLLKEFWDHDMIVSKRENAVGGEVLGVPWRREEMEAILEELMG